MWAKAVLTVHAELAVSILCSLHSRKQRTIYVFTPTKVRTTMHTHFETTLMFAFLFLLFCVFDYFHASHVHIWMCTYECILPYDESAVRLLVVVLSPFYMCRCCSVFPAEGCGQGKQLTYSLLIPIRATAFNIIANRLVSEVWQRNSNNALLDAAHKEISRYKGNYCWWWAMLLL